MELQLVITSDELLDYQRAYREYICKFPSVRQSELAWIAMEIVDKLSAATSKKCGWAVSATIKPAVTRSLSLLNVSDKPAKALRLAELARKGPQTEESDAAGETEIEDAIAAMSVPPASKPKAAAETVSRNSSLRARAEDRARRRRLRRFATKAPPERRTQ
jgi:hypothetical protein